MSNNATNLKSSEGWLNTRTCGFLKPVRKFMNACDSANRLSAWRLLFRFSDSENQGSTLRVGECYNFSEQSVSGRRPYFPTRVPRVRAPSVTWQISFEFEQLTLIGTSLAQFHDVRRLNLAECFVEHEHLDPPRHDRTFAAPRLRSAADRPARAKPGDGVAIDPESERRHSTEARG
jgi:hypothetical protein